MDYDRELALNLRLRGYSESEVADALRELHAYAKKSGTDIAETFGTPSEHAASFPVKGVRKRSRLGMVFAVLRAGRKPPRVD